MGCGNSNTNTKSVLYSSDEGSDEEIIDQKSILFNEINRKTIINEKKIKKIKKKFNANLDKVNLLLRHPYIQKDIKLIRRDEDYTIFFDKHEEVIRKVDLNKKTFKRAYWNLKAREVITEDFYIEKKNMRELIKDIILDNLDNIDEEFQELVKKICLTNEVSNDLSECIRDIFTENLYSNNEKAFFWNGEIINKELKDNFISNMIFSDSDFIDISRIKHFSLILTSDDIRKNQRILKFGYIIKRSNVRSLYICLKPIGDNYNKKVKLTFDCSNINLLLEDVSELKNLEAFVISAPQNVDYHFNKDTISLLTKISQLKKLKIFGSLRIDVEDEIIEEYLGSLMQAKQLVCLMYEPGIVKVNKEKYFRWIFTKFSGVSDNDELDAFFGNNKMKLSDFKGNVPSNDGYSYNDYNNKKGGKESNKNNNKKISYEEGKLKMLVLCGSREVNETERNKWIDNYRKSGFKNLEYILWESSIVDKEFYY